MTVLTIVADIKAKPDKTNLVKTELEKLINITREEAGCINYDLHQDDEDPSHFLFYENWQSHELWQAHMNNHHLQAFKVTTAGSIESLQVYQMSKIS